MPLPLSSSKKSSKPITLAASKGMHGPSSRSESTEEVDSSSAYSPSPTLMFDLASLLERLHSDPGYMALLSGKELELLAEMDLTDGNKDTEIKNEISKYDMDFLRQIQEAADRHLIEKNEIRDALGLLKIYHQAHTTSSSDGKPLPSSSKTIQLPSKSNGHSKDSSGHRNRKGSVTTKSESTNLPKLETQPEASPNKRRRDDEES